MDDNGRFFIAGSTITKSAHKFKLPNDSVDCNCVAKPHSWYSIFETIIFLKYMYILKSKKYSTTQMDNYFHN